MQNCYFFNWRQWQLQGSQGRSHHSLVHITLCSSVHWQSTWLIIIRIRNVVVPYLQQWDRYCITVSRWFPKTNKSLEFCEKPEQNEAFWCDEESGSRYLDRRRRRRASQTGVRVLMTTAALVVEEWRWRRSDSSLLNLMMLLSSQSPLLILKNKF